jgi:hypothetical protein
VNLDPLRRWEQRIGALPMPSPLVWVALVAAFLGFGVLLGRVTGPDSLGALASQRAPLKLLVARAPVAAATDPAPSPVAAPPVEAETTPEAVPPTGPAASPKSSKSPTAGKTQSTVGSKVSSGANEGIVGSEGTSGTSEGSSGAGEGSTSPGAKTKLPAIGHVFVVMLSDEPYATALGPSSPARYLTGTLEKQGELLLRYYAVAHEDLANGIALLSGQGPTEATAANCPTYTEINPTGSGPNGQLLGKGCVYPASTATLMSQLAAKRLSWKGYVEGIDEGGGEAPACAHPAPSSVDQSATQPNGQTPTPSYQTWRNPFVYFQAIVGSPTCVTRDVGIKRLGADLKSEASTPNFSYIAPGPCDDGSPTPCAPGKSAGMTPADSFLQRIVPQILSSAAYKKNGLLAITTDNAPSSGEYADSSSCCHQPRFPNLPTPTGAAALAGAGGGQVGLLLLSPFIKKGGGLAQETYNHFSLLATIEQVFGLSRLGYAGLPEVKPLSPSLFAGG